MELIPTRALAQTDAKGSPFDELYTRLDTIVDDSIKINEIYRYIAQKHRYAPLTKPLMQMADSIKNRIGSPYFDMFSDYHKAIFYIYNAPIDSSIYFAKRALEHPIMPDWPYIEADLLGLLANHKEKGGEFAEALQFLLKAERLLAVQKIDTSDQILLRRHVGVSATNFNAIANFYNLMDDEDLSLEYYNKAFALLYDNHLLTGAGVVKMNIGELLYNQGMYEASLEALQESVEIKQKAKMPASSIGNNQTLIARNLTLLRRPNEAQVILDTLVNLFEEEKSEKLLLKALVFRGLNFLELNSPDKALKDCKRCKELTDKYKETFQFGDVLMECLYKTYKALNKPQEALQYHERYTAIKDSLLNEKNIRELTSLKMQNDFEVERQFVQLQKENEDRIYKNRLSQLTIGLIGTLGILALLYYSYQLKTKSNKVLKSKNEIISKSLEEKEVLLKEIHHRVKNNLQVISSLLSLQSRKLEQQESKEALMEGRNRVRSMALIHQNLYQDEDLVGIHVQEYVQKLTAGLISNYNIFEDEIDFKTEVDPIRLDVDVAIPMGLILNELISNALKYAFTEDQKPKILKVELEERGSNLKLEVADNGKGLPPDFSIEKAQTLGFKLINSFTKKLNASLIVNSHSGGTKIAIFIPKSNSAFSAS